MPSPFPRSGPRADLPRALRPALRSLAAVLFLAYACACACAAGAPSPLSTAKGLPAASALAARSTTPTPAAATPPLVHVQLLADYARVNYVQGHTLPRSGLAGVGVNLSVGITKSIDLVVGYGYGIDAPRGRSFGGQEFDAQFELKW